MHEMVQRYTHSVSNHLHKTKTNFTEESGLVNSSADRDHK